MTDVYSCPVCGMAITPEHMLTLEYKGFEYLLCSLPCKQSFQKHPDMYIHMDAERLNEKNMELELVRKETIACLSRAAEYKDNETGKHTMRIASYSQRLAELAGLEDEHVELIRETSPMHDVGKIGVPENILLKQGALTPDERSIIEQHPEIGAEILGRHSQSKLMKMAAIIAMNHHEKWNGEGYPGGLKAEEIPIEGRIVAICDVFDALISVRPYKDAWPLDKIRDYFITQHGEHFDPALAKLFVQHFRDFHNIYNQLRDSGESHE